MLYRLIILAITIVVIYFSIWTGLCRLGCRPGRYGNTDDTLGVIRLPSCGTIGGPNSSRNFGPRSGASKNSVLKASSSNRNGPSVSVTSSSGTPSIPLKTEKALNPDASSSEIGGPGNGPTTSPSGGSSGPRKGTVSTPGSGPSGANSGTSSDPRQRGYVVPLFKQEKRARCTCEACPCALIEKFVIPVAQVGMNSVYTTSEHFNDFTDWLLLHLGVFVTQSRTAGPRQAQIIHSRTTMYDESVEELRLIENPGFQKQTVSINPSATVSLGPTVHNSMQYIRELLVKQISESFTGQKTSERSVKVPKEGSNQSTEVSEKVADLSVQKTEKAPNILPLKTEATPEITAKQIKETSNQAVKISEKAPDLCTQKTKEAPDLCTQESKVAPDLPTQKTKEAPDLCTQKTKEAPDVSNQEPEKAPDVSTQETVATSEIIVKKAEEIYDLTTQKSDKVSNLTVTETQTASNPPNKNSELPSAATSTAEEHKMLMLPPKQRSKLNSDASDDSKIIRPSENEETYDPGQHCSECARQGKVCMGGCPTAEKKIRQEQSKK